MHRHNRHRAWPLRLLTVAVATAVWLAGSGAVQAARPTPQVADWIRHHASRLATIDPTAPLDDLAPLRRMVGDAQVVGLGESTHGASEEITLKHCTLRLLVEELGFRSVAWEDDWTLGPQVNQYLLTGKGILAYDAVAAYVAKAAPQRLPELQRHLEPIRPFTPDIGEYVGWYYRVQDKQPYIDHARRIYEFVRGLPHPRGDRAWALALQHARQILSFYEYFSLSVPDSANYRDERAAENLRWWRQRTGDKVAYWAASPHTANAAGLQFSAPPAPLVRWDSAGSHLRRWYGEDYLSIEFTFDHGTVNVGSGQPPYTPVPVAVPRPEPDWGDRPLGDAGLDQFALDLRAGAPPAVSAWRRAPTKVRVIGSFAPQRPDAYYMTGGSLAQWFDVIVHRQVVTPWQPL